jgi:hypothetical protein
MNIFVAYHQYSPEDTAIGLGSTDEEAIEALIVAYPHARGKVIEVTTCELGKGLSSIEGAPIYCRTER